MIMLRCLFQDRGAIFTIAIITIYVVSEVLAPLIIFYKPSHIDTTNKFANIGRSHWLRTDHLGQDVLTRIIYTIRPSLSYVFVALIISVVIGTILGFISGYFPSYINAIIIRVCDMMLAFPSYAVTLALITLSGMGVESITIAFILTRWAWFCRMIQASVMQYTEADHIKFAKVIGMNDPTIVRKRILPLTFTSIAIIVSNSICSMVLQMSGFSFLGLGVKAPTAKWGMILNEAWKVIFTHPGMMMTTDVAIVIIVTAFNFLSNALQMAIDPRMSTKEKRLALKRGVKACDTA